MGSVALSIGVSIWLWLAGSAAAAEDATPTLKVSGKASIEAEATRYHEGFEVRATLRDEVGRPLPNAEVRVRAAPATEGSATLHRCSDPRGEAAGELLLSTDKLGRVCITVTGMPSGNVELGFRDPRGYLARASRIVQLPENVAGTFELGFDPPLSTVALDLPVQELGLVARARGGATLPEGAELVLSLDADGSERELTRVTLEGIGEAQRLSVASTGFGHPGPARLLGRLRARDGTVLAETGCAITRTASVALHVSDGARHGIEAGAALQVRAVSALGPAPSGAVEARSRGISVAVGRVEHGVATLLLPTAPSTLLSGTLSLEYVGEGPGWLPGPPLELRVLPAGVGYGRYALWFAAAALAALAVVLGWRRPARVRVAAATEQPPRARASVEVLEAYPAGGGYRGFVRDTHEGTAITPALVSFIGPGPTGTVLAQARTNAAGAFSIEQSNFPSGTRIEVTAPYHATLMAPVPVPGVIELSLISRRRALLDRLVRWAERRGKPWTRSSGDPTPAHIAGIASSEAEPQVEHWARGLEHLAFGPNPPDAASEQAAGVTEDPKTSRERGID